jgi:ABC-type branched-subunit amino acid transport system ATPase component
MVVAAQDLPFALSIADDLIVLDRGRVVYRAESEQARAEIDKIRALLVV